MYYDRVTIPVCLNNGASKVLIGNIRFLSDGDRAGVKTKANKVFYIKRGVVFSVKNDNGGERILNEIGRVA